MLRRIFLATCFLMIKPDLHGYKNQEFSDFGAPQSCGEHLQVAVVPVSHQTLVADLSGSSNQFQKFTLNNTIVGYVFGAVELYAFVRNYIVYKKWLQHLSYHEFMISFAYLLLIEEQIARIQDLLYVSSHGTLPEQVMARINLVRSSLVCPYDRVMNECAKKYFKANFDESGHLIWHDSDDAMQYYKKFHKKIPQDFRALVYGAKKISSDIKNIYVSDIAAKTENAYNQTLLDIVYAGIDQNFPLLKKLCRSYYDRLFEKLYQYYIDQKVMKHRQFYGVADSDPAIKNMIDFVFERRERDMTEEMILQEWYGREMMNWLCPFQAHSKIVQDSMRGLLSDEQILVLPFNPQHRFVLLRACLDKICLGDQTGSELFHELFLPNGILKKYKNHVWLQDRFDHVCLQDDVMQKAVNFALAICEKENDDTTQQRAKHILQYVFCAYESKDSAEFACCKNKIVVLYEALSYKKI